MTIQILPEDVARRIAAGEVVERPASAVKELLENSLDAGATTIRVEIEQGGKRLIKIIDDGCGIPREEVALAFQPHATSKLRKVDDLDKILTLGFRGEALASIAAVAQVSMITRPTGDVSGTNIRFVGGKQEQLTAIGSPVGTAITVENLFFNVPPRKKFLKSNATETGHIQRIISHYALAYPQVRFSFVNQGRTSIQTDGSGNLYDVLVSLWGVEQAKQMVEVQEEEGDIKVSGYVSTPALHRSQRDQMIFFTNRRWIQDKSLAFALSQAYQTMLPVGRHPVAVLNIELPPHQLDINIHPTKSEVRFQNPQRIFKAVQRPVRKAVIEQSPVIRTMQGIGDSQGERTFSQQGHGHRGHGMPSQGERATQFALEVQRPFDEDETVLPNLRVVGQIQRMYIIAEGDKGLYLIDQHAAHERILYEKLMRDRAESGVTRQRLLTPPLMELAPAKFAVLEAELDTLQNLGFELEHFGGQAYRLLAIPELFNSRDPAFTFNEILADMAEGVVPLSREAHDRVATIVCKRISIKGGQSLSFEEMNELIKQLGDTEQPRTCPHGRPTMMHLSAYQLAKEFGRH